jgi:response regulator RpfG family c-di-GMP phosphodiesterase
MMNGYFNKIMKVNNKNNFTLSMLFIISSNFIPFIANLISLIFFFNFIIPLTVSKIYVIPGMVLKSIFPQTVYLYFVQIIPFFLPLILLLIYLMPIISYSRKKDVDKNKKNKLGKKILNTPIIASLAGISGWGLGFINAEIIYLISFRYSNFIVFLKHFITNFLVIMTVSILCFIISYYLLELINRKFFIRKFFYQSKLSNYTGIFNITIMQKFYIYFFAINIYPFLFIFIVLLRMNITNQFNNIEILLNTCFIFIITGAILTYLVSKTFQNPLNEINNATKKITDGFYNIKVTIKSVDEIGCLGESINSMTAKLKQSNKRLQTLRYATIFGLAKLAENRDDSTGKHLERIRDYSVIIARKLSQYPKFQKYITEYYIHDIYESSVLHDIGKVGIPDSILLKPDKLSPDEFEIVKEHTIIGGNALKTIEDEVKYQSFLTLAIQIAYSHHERWNGKGYPKGLKEESIPLSARIVSIADIYDALTTERPYKKPWTHDEAKDFIMKNSGEIFDPIIVKAFLDTEEEFHRVRKSYIDPN